MHPATLRRRLSAAANTSSRLQHAQDVGGQSNSAWSTCFCMQYLHRFYEMSTSPMLTFSFAKMHCPMAEPECSLASGAGGIGDARSQYAIDLYADQIWAVPRLEAVYVSFELLDQDSVLGIGFSSVKVSPPRACRSSVQTCWLRIPVLALTLISDESTGQPHPPSRPPWALSTAAVPCSPYPASKGVGLRPSWSKPPCESHHQSCHPT